jgi:hypothetical protein
MLKNLVSLMLLFTSTLCCAQVDSTSPYGSNEISINLLSYTMNGINTTSNEVLCAVKFTNGFTYFRSLDKSKLKMGVNFYTYDLQIEPKEGAPHQNIGTGSRIKLNLGLEKEILPHSNIPFIAVDLVYHSVYDDGRAIIADSLGAKEVRLFENSSNDIGVSFSTGVKLHFMRNIYVRISSSINALHYIKRDRVSSRRYSGIVYYLDPLSSASLSFVF